MEGIDLREALNKALNLVFTKGKPAALDELERLFLSGGMDEQH